MPNKGIVDIVISFYTKIRCLVFNNWNVLAALKIDQKLYNGFHPITFSISIQRFLSMLPFWKTYAPYVLLLNSADFKNKRSRFSCEKMSLRVNLKYLPSFQTWRPNIKVCLCYSTKKATYSNQSRRIRSFQLSFISYTPATHISHHQLCQAGILANLLILMRYVRFYCLHLLC